MRHNSVLIRIIDGGIEGINNEGRPLLDYIFSQIIRDCRSYCEFKKKSREAESGKLAFGNKRDRQRERGAFTKPIVHWPNALIYYIISRFVLYIYIYIAVETFCVVFTG